MAADEEISRLLHDMRRGDPRAEAALVPRLYDELHALAHRLMQGERADHTLQTTALIHEAYLRLGGGGGNDFEDEAHFLRAAARAMRRVLIDHARKKRTAKRGGTGKKVSMSVLGDLPVRREVDLVALDGALEKLGTLDPKLLRVVELRFFGGFTLEETARILGISPRTAKYDWRLAKAWLREEMGVRKPGAR